MTSNVSRTTTDALRLDAIIFLPLRSVTFPTLKMISDREIFSLYGKHALISRKGGFVLVHLDRPSRAVLQKRTRDFEADRFFEKDCPICAVSRARGIVVFDETRFDDDEEIFME
jgi:hypothetical protein